MNLITHGIDISENNGAINWDLVKTNIPTIDYVFIKVSEGATRRDPLAQANANGCQRVGIPFGYYHFAYPNGADPVQDAINEADFFISLMANLPKATMTPVLDIESNPGGFSREQVQLWIKTFIMRMKSKGYSKVILYSYAPFLNDNLPANHIFGDVPLWLAAYVNSLLPALPRGWNNFYVWQFTGKGRVNGIQGDVDINRAAPELIKALKIGSGIIAGLLLLGTGLFFLVRWYNRKKKKEKRELENRK